LARCGIYSHFKIVQTIEHIERYLNKWPTP
jgi:hypothetical protein